MNNKLIRISLQFFGEDPEDFEDFEDEYEEEEELGGGDDAEDADEDNDAGPEENENKEDDAESNQGEGDTTSEVIAELKANGFVGESLADLISDMKTKREAKAADDKSKARKADLASSKAHVKASRPAQSANGEASGGFSERQVSSFAEVAGCSKEEARKLLRHQMKLMGG